jgi:peptide/nickel transport system permease protein
LVLLRHALPNALLPVVTQLGLQIGTLIGGAAIVETVFAWPGAGRLLVGAVLQRDFPLLQFGVLVVAATVILANLLVDLAYGLLDPRLRERPT